jgi:type II secretory pathway predicted ATPase ExeA
MYEQFYGLSELPFSLLPDADFLFLSRRHRRAVNLLEYGIVSQAGFIAITGDVGAGKTTIVRRFIKNAGREITVGVISNPSNTLGRLLDWIAMAFDFEQVGQDPAKAYDTFVKFLLAHYAKGKRTVLIIDEAQNLPPEMLEELRMLSNVNNEKDQLLQIVLVGQPELLEMLNRPELRQFAQRIAVHCHLDPLIPSETAAYIRHRLAKVGGAPDMFSDTTCATVHYFTGGVPRLINLLCDQALVYGFSEDEPTISPQMVLEVVFDRARSGLSAFRVLPEGWTTKDLQKDITEILNKIQSAEDRAEL